MQITKVRKILIAVVAILGAFTALQANAGVSSVMTTTCREGTGFTQNNDDFVKAQFNDSYLSLSYINVNTAGNTCNKGLVLFDTGRNNSTVTSVKIEWEVDTLISSTCTLYTAGITLDVGGGTITTPHDVNQTGFTSLVSTTTDTVRRQDTITNPTATGQFALGWGGGSGQEGCIWKIYSIRDQNDVDIMRNLRIAPTTADSSGGGGGGGEITFPDEPLITHDVGTTLALSTLAGIMSILTILYVVRNNK